MNNPKVSVVITTYNRENYLKFAVDSVLNQTYCNFELIIIDDGSSDNTKELIKSYTDGRIKYYYQENAGQNAARNLGMKLSKGKYIAHLDSDDIWIDEKLEKQVNILDNNPDIGIVYCGSLIIDEQNEIVGQKPLATYSENVLKKIIMTNFLYNGSCALFRKNCLDRVGYFDESLKRMTDWDFYLRFALYFKFYGLKEYLLKYRIHNETMSKDYKSYETYGIKILEKLFEHKDLDRKYLRYKNKAIALRYKYMGRRYFENKSNAEARKYFNQALNLDPFLYCSSSIFILKLLTYFPSNITDQFRVFKRQIRINLL